MVFGRHGYGWAGWSHLNRISRWVDRQGIPWEFVTEMESMAGPSAACSGMFLLIPKSTSSLLSSDGICGVRLFLYSSVADVVVPGG